MTGRTRVVSKDKYATYVKRSNDFQSIAETAAGREF